MSQEEEDQWSQAVEEHFQAAECEVCHQHVVLGETGGFIPVGGGFWAVWYHYACKPDAFRKDE